MKTTHIQKDFPHYIMVRWHGGSSGSFNPYWWEHKVASYIRAGRKPRIVPKAG